MPTVAVMPVVFNISRIIVIAMICAGCLPVLPASGV